MAKDLINVFVSHYHKDEDNIKRMKDLLGDDYSIRNYSVTSEKYNNASNKEYIQSLLRPLINQASTFICLIGPNTHDSEWVNWEVEQALKHAADAMVGWNHDTILDAINGNNIFTNADGTVRPNVGGSRVTC